MDQNLFRIQARESMGNLHLHLEGIFDGGSALVLTSALREGHMHCNRLFINTDKLERVEPHGAFVLRAFLRHFPRVADRIYFKGKNGPQMALEGQRVLQIKPHHGCGCPGRCKVCKCAERKKQREAATGGKAS